MLKRLVAALICSTWSAAASANVLVFECTFSGFDRPVFFTIYDDGSRAGALFTDVIFHPGATWLSLYSPGVALVCKRCEASLRLWDAVVLERSLRRRRGPCGGQREYSFVLAGTVGLRAYASSRGPSVSWPAGSALDALHAALEDREQTLGGVRVEPRQSPAHILHRNMLRSTLLVPLNSTAQRAGI